MKSSGKSREPKKTPPWAGKRGPGYEFDEEGDLVWFASASFMAIMGPADSTKCTANTEAPNTSRQTVPKS